MKGREVREGREREGRGEIQPQQQQSTARRRKKKKKCDRKGKEERRVSQNGKHRRWSRHHKAQSTHTKEEKLEQLSLLVSLPIGHSKHTTKKDTAEKGGEKEEEKDAHRLVADKKE